MKNKQGNVMDKKLIARFSKDNRRASVFDTGKMDNARFLIVFELFDPIWRGYWIIDTGICGDEQEACSWAQEICPEPVKE